MLTAAIKTAFVALSLCLDVFAVSVGVGVRGVPARLKWRIGAAFAAAEVGMNLIGAGLGFAVGKLLGHVAGYIGFGALVLLGAFMIKESLGSSAGAARLDLSKGWGLLLASLSISLDSLGIGFSILYIGVPPEISLSVIAATSVGATILGLNIGQRLGAFAERRAALVGGILLMLTGLAFIALKAFHLE